MSRHESVDSWVTYPEGCSPSDINARHFAVYVKLQLGLGWIVTTVVRDERLSVKGRKWCHYVTPRQRRHYYFASFEEAQAAAREAADIQKINGRAWSEWAALSSAASRFSHKEQI